MAHQGVGGERTGHFLENDDSRGRWEANKLPSSDRRILITQWIAKTVAIVGEDDKSTTSTVVVCVTGVAMTADGTDYIVVNLEGHGGECSHGREGAREPLNKMLPISPASSDEKLSAGSRDEEDDGTGAGGSGNGESNQRDKLALADYEETLSLKVPPDHAVECSAPAVCDAALVKKSNTSCCGGVWAGSGVFTAPQEQGRTRHISDHRVFVERDSSTISVKLSFHQYPADGTTQEGSWPFVQDLDQKGSHHNDNSAGRSRGEGVSGENGRESFGESNVDKSDEGEGSKGRHNGFGESGSPSIADPRREWL